MVKRKNILVIHGPNLNMLGKREPELYGTMTLEDINAGLAKKGKSLGVKVDAFQSNHEGAIIDKIQGAGGVYSGLIINPAAYTHTSVGIRDAILLLKMPVIEIHLSNIYKREPFRHKSMIADVATAQLAGFGPMGYSLALEAVVQMIE
ncbi:MAG: type II 3-dehydroquinate dehydratase [Desulfobacteraceae bacterium]|nr:type II 3-dehydroquinate dehydratase [Desulfobacteraceae bacterium]MBU4001240.1 type II 3-dehydroquinate dehydratase [Pseudomonadota bacterium]MBU4055410.1 type II 3-dehydroquinate dehydratase [Pseudomonadota bacterium]